MGTTAAPPANPCVPQPVPVHQGVPPHPTVGTPPVNVLRPYGLQPPLIRQETAKAIRVGAAEWEATLPLASHHPNQDEVLYKNSGYIGNYSKGLCHDLKGRVDATAYQAFLHAAQTGQPSDWGKVPLGGNIKLVNPQSGLCFDLEGADAPSLSIPAAWPVLSEQRATEAIELYWMALCRDIPFTEYGGNNLSSLAIQELDNLPLRDQIFGGPVTAQTLFRGNTPGERIGPYISQFFLQPAGFGDLSVLNSMANPAQQYTAYQPNLDYMTGVEWWLRVQNGQSPFNPPPANNQFGKNIMIGPRYLFNGRGGAAFVHVDELYQAYFMAALNLLDDLKGNSYDQENPYQAGVAASGASYTNQAGFGTFGNPHVATLVAEVATRALKAQWFQKWFVHRTLRPEEYGGLVHFAKTQAVDYQLPQTILGSQAVEQTFKQFGSYLLPQAFPEGSPQHPSYGSGHATVAGACATIIKAFFNEDLPMPNPIVAAGDGITLDQYSGPELLCLGHEANKIAGNVGMFRNHAGVHWRSDHEQSILLGEQIGIRILQDQKWLYNEEFTGWTFTTFGGEYIQI